MSHGGTSALSILRDPKVLDTTHSPVGLWWFDGDLTDETTNDDLSVNAGTLQYTASHEHGRQAARLRDNAVRLLGAAPAPAPLLVTGDVTVEAVVLFDTTVGTDTFGTTLIGCNGIGGNAAASQNALYSLQASGLYGTGQMVPQFLWENSETYQYIDDENMLLTLGQWYHIVGVREAAGGGLCDGRLYVNGQLIDEQTDLPYPTDGSASRMTVGRDTNGAGGGWLGGIISSAKVIDRALSAREVLGEYQYVAGERPTPEIIALGGPTVPGANYGDIAWFPFETDLLDVTGNHTMSGTGIHEANKDGYPCLQTENGGYGTNGNGLYLVSQADPPSNLATTEDVTVAFALWAPQALTSLVDMVFAVSQDGAFRNYGFAWWYDDVSVKSPIILQGDTLGDQYTIPIDQSAVTYGAWEHHALRYHATRNGANTVDWYVDGALRESITMDADTAEVSGSNRLKLGSATQFYRGGFWLRHFMISNSILTPTQISDLKTAAIGP